MNSESVHLIATDPPFNKGRDFHATPDSLASGASFQDRWSWDRDVHQEWVDQITDDFPKVMNVIQGSRNSYGDDMGAFLCFMAVRLLEMHRILREDGSIYLHCDSTASHYFKGLMDSIFGSRNFRNDIVWRRTEGAKKSQYTPKKWGRSKDNILYYVKSKSTTVLPYKPLSDNEATEKFVHRDEKGRYFTKGLTLFRRPSQGARPNLCYEWRGFSNKHPAGWCLSKERLEEEYQKGNVVIITNRQGKRILERRKYEHDYPGAFADDIWTEITNLTGSDRELTGYPTQKPLALYERIIRASSKKGDIVLDPFAGCATTCVAAERLGRKWVGIDIWNRVEEVVLDRLEKEGLTAPKYTRRSERNRQNFLFSEDMHFTSELPVRTDDGGEAVPFLQTTFKRKLEPWERLSRNEIFQELQSAQSISEGYVLCAGCGREMEPPFMELDHIVPRSGGGENNISNRILLCRPCNGTKSNDKTILGLRKNNRASGWMQDEQLAERALKLARQRCDEIRYRT